jgi:hypothetical protein
MLLALAAVALLKGSVTIGPVTPVCRAGVPCDRPAARVVLAFTSGSRVVRTTTSATGSYAVRLSPGTYTVTASAGMRIAPSLVSVHPGTQRRSFAIDTGIR